MSEEAEVPTQWSHDVKLESTAKGLRIHVHVYANGITAAVTQAFKTYKEAVKEAEELNIPIAPMEIEKK